MAIQIPGGYNPASGLRLSEQNRWPGVLRHELGSGFDILEDGKKRTKGS